MLELFVDVGVGEQIKVVESAEVLSVVDAEGDRASAAVPGRARELHQQIADEHAEWVVLVACDGDADEVVGHMAQEWHFVATVGEELVGVDTFPVVFEEGSEPQILHPHAAGVQYASQPFGLGNPIEDS